MGELHDGVQQPDQNGNVLRTAKHLLEHEIDGGFDPSNLGFLHQFRWTVRSRLYCRPRPSTTPQFDL